MDKFTVSKNEKCTLLRKKKIYSNLANLLVT